METLMQAKRIAIAVISLLIGVVTTALTVFVLFETSLAHFEYVNAFLLCVSIAGVIAIWLDYFLGTNILKS
jgi:hypothetical protein